MFKDILFPLELRKYQKAMLEDFDKKLVLGKKHFHYVSPPGSGKTILGLEMFRRIGEKAVVFSPNSAIQSQWIAKLSALSNEITSSTDPFSSSDLLSLTYQSIAVKKRDTDELHENSQKILENLKDRKLIILDECHHLVNFWAEVLKDFISDDFYVIGLTATPPIHRNTEEVNTYMSILKEVDMQVPLPAVVKEGNLAPFQDLVYLTKASENELKLIDSASKKYGEVLKELEDLDPPLTSLPIWVEMRLEEFKTPRGRVVAFDELLLEKPDLAIAFVRYAKKINNEIPLSVILIDEMEDVLTLSDMILILEDYAINYLQNTKEGDSYYKKLKSALKDLGFSFRKNAIVDLKNTVSSVLGLSSNKIKAMEAILEHEHLYMQEDLRALVLTDFSNGKEENGTSALTALKAITSNPVIDPVDPILLTGTTVLVDDDLLPAFLEEAEIFFKRHALNVRLEYKKIEGYYEISGIGPDWNTKTYVIMITGLFGKGITKCLVGTKSLLGEGWDSIELNTLIDLTLVTTYVSVNQIRGRSIRINEERPFKTANNWDIVVLGEGERGFSDFERFEKKHAQFYGISDDNMIEKGIGHVHPLLTNVNHALLLSYKDQINKDMFLRATNRLKIYKDWGIGEEYKSNEAECVEFSILKESKILKEPEHNEETGEQEGDKKKKKKKRGREPRFRIAKVSQKKKEKYMHYLINMRKRLIKRPIWIHLCVSFLISLFVNNLTSIFEFPPHFIVLYDFLLDLLIIITIIFSILGIVFIERRGDKKLKLLKARIDQKLGRGESFKSNLKYFALVVFDSLREIGEIENSCNKQQIEITLRSDGTYRVLLKGSLNSKIFCKSLSELLSPISNQRYIIEQKQVSYDKADWKSFLKNNEGLAEGILKVEKYYAVPTVLGKTRLNARIFQRYWNKYISPGEVIYSSSKKGKAIIKRFFRVKPMNVSKRKKEIWL